MPLNSRLPLICSWRPMSTLTPPRHLAVDAGTQRMRASSGLRCLAWAAAGASRPATASPTSALEVLRAPVTLKANRVRRWKFRGIRRLTLTSQMGHEFRQRPPRVGLSMLAKAAVASLVIVLCSGGAVAASILLQVHKIVHPAPIPGEPKPEPALKIPTEPVKPGGPRTLLVLGSDRRSKRSADAKIGFTPRSDTILLVRLDPKRKRVAVMSIPRDLAVTIPGHGEQTKINEAYALGGAKLTTDTAKQLFETAPGKNSAINGVIDVNFNASQQAVNYAHGVYVDVDRRYFIPPNSGTSEIDLQPGYQRLVGSAALAYVRYRHTDSDIFRAARQPDFLRQAVGQPAVQKLKSLGEAGDFLAVMRSYFRFDTHFLSTKNVFGMLKTAVALSQGHAPVNQIQFRGVQDSEDPATDTRLYMSQDNLQRVYTEFMTGEKTQNPVKLKKATKRKKVTASKVSGLENAANL